MRHFTHTTLKQQGVIDSLNQHSSHSDELHPAVMNNASEIMKEVSTLYVGNLSEACTEELLAKVFGRFGLLVQLKIMWPRQDHAGDQMKNICAFVKYENFAPAYLVKQKMHETKLLDLNMKVVWSKNIAPVARASQWLAGYKGISDNQLEMDYLES
jgi:RNA recognition motif-containing protein